MFLFQNTASLKLWYIEVNVIGHKIETFLRVILRINNPSLLRFQDVVGTHIGIPWLALN